VRGRGERRQIVKREGEGADKKEVREKKARRNK
jgi:hypothetical protein